MLRKSGVLMHISSLFGDYSIGCFGDEAKYFIDFLADCGFSYWQVLPFCPLDKYNSAYKSTSVFAGNPYFISLKTLFRKGLLTSDDIYSQKQFTPYVCEYERLSIERLSILKTASRRAENKIEIDDFISQNQYIENFCKFMAIKKANNNRPWQEWEHENYNDDDLFLWKFIQYEFFNEWRDIKQYANSKGIKIIGDMPIYTDSDSSDVWADRHLFKLDENNLPAFVAGVAPDYFSRDGQNWGNPIYNWMEMEKENFRWLKDRISFMANMFDGIRLDHFKAFESFWEIPASAKSAKEGTMSKGPGLKLIEEIKKSSENTLIIAEDLGLITNDTKELLRKSGFYGMRVFQFAFLSEKNSTHLPHNYINHCIAYTGTHDNNTLLGYLGELDEKSRKYVFKYCAHYSDNFKDGCDAIIRSVLASSAGLVIIPIQDLLHHGADARLNTPGKAEGNWGYRITKEQLDSIDRKKMKELNELYARA